MITYRSLLHELVVSKLMEKKHKTLLEQYRESLDRSAYETTESLAIVLSSLREMESAIIHVEEKLTRMFTDEQKRFTEIYDDHDSVPATNPNEKNFPKSRLPSLH